jgi:general secretion pathway protein D
MTNRLKTRIAAIALVLPLIGSCASYNSYEKARTAERMKDWDQAVIQYEKALQVDPENLRFKISLQRARLEASRVHFEKAKALRAGALTSTNPPDALRLNQLAASDFELAVKLDPTNQYAAVEMAKCINAIQDALASRDKNSLEERKKRANNITKAQPPQLNPASEAPISLTFPHETPVKEIYHALGNAFGINILFDQAVKDDRISIELKDVTAQQALERVMQAANHFYKVLDEHTIIVVPDNPQARRDYEDLVIRTFYLSNGDAEQVTNVVRTMIEARNLFPLKSLNAITIRDTADKVRIAEKIIEANDKAKAEVIVDVELLELDLTTSQDFGAFITGLSSASGTGNLSTLTSTAATGTGTATATTTGGFAVGSVKQFYDAIRGGNFQFNIPTVAYNFAKSAGNATTLANPELRISEGEKATLHIGQRVPVPVTTFQTAVTGTNGGTLPATSFQYQDVGIKVAIEPRIHHNHEVTLKLTVEVSDIGEPVDVGGGTTVPKFITRTIEDTIRLKDGETNFLAGLIQKGEKYGESKTPILGDIPILGRLFTSNSQDRTRTDLMLTMTPHIIRMPDITDDDLAPMWVGTQNNLTFRGVSPRIESQSAVDPFNGTPPNLPTLGGEPGNYIQPAPAPAPAPAPTTPVNGAAPSNLFRPQPAPPPQPPNPEPQSMLVPSSKSSAATAATTTSLSPILFSPASTATSSGASAESTPNVASLSVASTDGAAPAASVVTARIEAQPGHLGIKPGEMKTWSVVGMDLDGLSTDEILLHYDPRTMAVMDVSLGNALRIDPAQPPAVVLDSGNGLVRISSSNGKPLLFQSGGDIATLRVQGGLSGETFLVVDIHDIHNARGETVTAQVVGGRAKVD